VREVFADTFHFLALLNPRDLQHGRAAEAATQEHLGVVTTRAVLLEVADAFADASTRSIAAEFLGTFEADPNATIIEVDAVVYHRGLTLYRDRPDKDWSLTDCISFVVMGDRGLTEALTGDHHFTQAGFIPLLAQAP